MKSDLVFGGTRALEVKARPLTAGTPTSTWGALATGGTTAVFVDAGYLEKLGPVDVDAVEWGVVIPAMAAGQRLLCSFYYDCLPYIGHSPTNIDLARLRDRRLRHACLEQGPGFVVRLGKLERRVERDQFGDRVKFVQKRVDMKLGVDLVWLACKGLITHAAVLAGDSDFIPAVETARTEGVHVHLFHGATAHADLIAACDGHTHLVTDGSGLHFNGGRRALL